MDLSSTSIPFARLPGARSRLIALLRGRSALASAGALVLAGLSSPMAPAVEYSHGDPTDLEQYQLEMVNAARANPPAEAARLGIDLNQGLSPGRIDAEPKPPLAFHPLLLQAARNHSDWMLASGTFSHTGAGGSSPSDRAAAVGYTFEATENLGYKSTSGIPDLEAFTEDIHDGLFLSPSHRTNLMDPSPTVVGLGIRPGTFRGTSGLMVTQKFSAGGDSVDSGPFLLGVVYDDANSNGRYDPGEGIAGVRVEPSWGGYHAITSDSGGYAVPLPPSDTISEREDLPFPVRSASWDSVRPYDEAYRKRKISEAAEIPLRITWSGGPLAAPVETLVTIRRPVRINYRLFGTDSYYYDRTMVSSENGKADFNVVDPPAPAPPPGPEISVIASSGSDLFHNSTASRQTFTTTDVGSLSAAKVLTIRNDGHADLGPLSLSLEGTHHGDFRVGSLSATTLAPGASATFRLRFKPRGAGARSAVLRISSNDSNEGAFAVRLAGTGRSVAPDIDIRKRSGPALASGGPSTNLGRARLGLSQRPVRVAFTIRNSGGGTLNLGSLRLAGRHRSDFTVSAPRIRTLVPGSSTTITVTFRPGAAGRRNAVLSVRSNDPDEARFKIRLTGRGVL